MRRFVPGLARLLGMLVATFALSACATIAEQSSRPGLVDTIQILALNDFHGHLEPPTGSTIWFANGKRHEDRLGGAARVGSALGDLRRRQPYSITVAAGDLIGASPLASAHFLDEPTIMALNRMGLELAAVGNHEFDRGTAELRRMQEGGCEAYTSRQPCALDQPFEGARFTFLAANVLDERGESLFPGTALRDFGSMRVGFIGMTLEGTDTLVAPAATAGYRFAPEVETANTQVRLLQDSGADAIVLLIHQGGLVDPFFSEAGCPGLSGEIVPILEGLDPAIGLVVSGHTHAAYVCERPGRDGARRLLTSAGRYGNFVTDIRMTIERDAETVVAISAVNRPILPNIPEQPDIAALVKRYVKAADPIATRMVGRIEGNFEGSGGLDSAVANLVADAQLAATRAQGDGGAQMAFINSGGIRTRFQPGADGSVTYGQIFALQPFGNILVVLKLRGDQIRQVLEQQFTDETPAQIRQSLLIPSTGLSVAFDRSRPPGQRIIRLELDGEPLDPDVSYRVTVNNFLASGGDGFSVFTDGRLVTEGGLDLDALESFIARGVRWPNSGRIIDIGADVP
jgi:5'-nucleotidase